MDENYLDDLLKEVSSTTKPNKNFDNNVNSDSGVDIDMSDLDDISLDELDNLDDLDLGDLDLSELDLDEVDFDDLDVTRLDVRTAVSASEDSFTNEDFSLEDLVRESEESEEEEYEEVLEEPTVPLEDFPFVDSQPEEEYEKTFWREPGESLEQLEPTQSVDLDELLGGTTTSEDALFDSVFSEANNQATDESDSSGLDLDDLFSALGIEEENTGDSNPYTAGEAELDELFTATNASAIELGELNDIQDISEPKGKKKKNKKIKDKNKPKKTLSEIVFGEPDEDDFEEEELFKQKQAEKAEKKEQKKAQKETKKQEKLEIKKDTTRKKNEAKHQKKLAKQEELRIELEAEKGQKKVPTPVIIIVFLAFAVLGAVIVLGSKEFNYAQVIGKAADYFERHRYRLAYDEVSGVEIKEDDVELRDRIYTVMYVERLYESYENNMSLGRYDKALDALLRGLEKYDVHYEEAVELDIVEDIDYCRDKIVTALEETYGISESEAYLLMMLEGQEYTIMLDGYCENFE